MTSRDIRELSLMRSTRSGRFAILGFGLLLASCGASKLTAPPAAAAPEVVLRAYLEALVRSDCSAGRAVGTASFGFGSGELCGHTTVTAYTISIPPATPNATEAVFATSLTTTGTADGSVQPGSLTWFYDLKRQPSGEWRIVGGGSGP